MLTILRQTPRQFQRSLFLVNIQIKPRNLYFQRNEIYNFSSKGILTNLLNPFGSNSKQFSNEWGDEDIGDILSEPKNERIPRVNQNSSKPKYRNPRLKPNPYILEENEWGVLNNEDILAEPKNERISRVKRNPSKPINKIPRVKQNPHILDDNVLYDVIEPGQDGEIMKKINSVLNVNDLLLCYAENAESLNEKHLVECFVMLDGFALKRELNLTLLKGNNIYRALCNQLKQNCSQLSIDDLIKVFTCMIRIRVPLKSVFFEVIITNILQNIKKLTERDLVFLNHVLRKVPPIGMVRKIKILCNLEYQLKYESLSLCDLSTILFDSIECGGDHIGKILTEIYEHGSLNIEDPVKDLLWNLMYAQKELLTMDKDDYQKINVIMSECLEILSKNILQLNTEEVLSVLSQMCRMNNVNFPCKYNLSFPDAVVSFVLSSSLPVDAEMQICVKLMELNYASGPLCNHTIEQIVNNPNECSNASVKIIPLLHSFACCSRDHSQLRNALDILMHHKQIESIQTDITKEYLSLIHVLLMLDYCQEEIMMKVSDDEFLSKFLEKYSEPISHLQLMRIDHALSTQESVTQRIPSVYLEQGCKFISELRTNYSMLYNLLREVFQPEFVASNVYTSEGLHIDHMLILDQNNCPQELVYERELRKGINIKDIYAADYCKVIAINDVHRMRVFSPEDLISGTVYIKEKVLQNAGYQVVLLLQPLLYRLTKEDRQDFVKRELINAGVVI